MSGYDLTRDDVAAWRAAAEEAEQEAVRRWGRVCANPNSPDILLRRAKYLREMANALEGLLILPNPDEPVTPMPSGAKVQVTFITADGTTNTIWSTDYSLNATLRGGLNLSLPDVIREGEF